MGRVDEARALFERLVGLANDVGLLAEEYDPRSRRLLGNFPQAFSHVAMVNSAYNLSRIDSRQTGRHIIVVAPTPISDHRSGRRRGPTRDRGTARSHRTVGSHLYRIFPKLGITSRRQLLGWCEADVAKSTVAA